MPGARLCIHSYDSRLLWLSARQQLAPARSLLHGGGGAADARRHVGHGIQRGGDHVGRALDS